MRRLAVVCTLILLVCAVAQSDVIHTVDGRKITGKIVREDADTVTIKARYGGEITLDRLDIERIEKGKLPEEIYEEKAGTLDKADAQGHYELGMWCKKNSLPRQAKEEFQKAIAAGPDHEGARKELGYRKIEGKWVSAAEPRRKNEPRSKAASLSSARMSGLLKLIAEALKNGNLSDAAKEKLESFNSLSKKDFEKVAAKIAEWKTYKPQSQEDFTVQAAGMQTFVHLPPGYNPKKSYPLIITLHGAGGNGQNLRGAWANTKTNWGRKVRAGYIVVAPTWQPA